MRKVRGWLARLRGSFATAQKDRELAEELESHLQMEIDELVGRGMNPEDARRIATLRAGGIETAKEAYRDQRGFPFLDHLRRDLVYAARTIRSNPGLTLVTVVSLGLAIAANTAVFTLTDAVFLKTLPVTNPDELVLLEWTGPEETAHAGVAWGSYSGSITGSNTPGELIGASFSMPLFQEIESSASTLSGVFAFANVEQLNVVDRQGAGIARGQLVTGGYYNTLRVPAVQGRTIVPSDDRSGAEAVGVLSFRYWQSRFGGDPSVMGRVVSINGVPTTIIGVTPERFVGTLDVGELADITLPMSLFTSVSPGGNEADLTNPDRWWVQIMGRRGTDVTPQQTEAELKVIFGRALQPPRVPAGSSAADPTGVEVRPRIVSGSRGPNDSRRDYRLPTALLTGISGLVLLLACTNVVTLLLSRAVARRREITMRLALGASRRRILGQLLTEALVFAVLAESLGLLLAVWGKNLLLGLRYDAAALDLQLDGRGFAVATIIATGTALLCGLTPALHAIRGNLSESLKSAARTARGLPRTPWRGALLVAQISVSVVLLFGSALFLGTLRNLNAIDVGFDQDQLLLFRIDPRLSGYEGDRVPGLYKELQQRYREIPGVDAVSYARHSLLTGSLRTDDVSVVGDAERRPVSTLVNPVGPAFFETMRLPILLGRAISAEDDSRGQAVVVINDGFARTRFPGENPLGHRLDLSGVEVEIVGVASDARYRSVREASEPTVYMPFLRFERGQGSFAIRSAVNPETIIASVRRATAEIDPTLSIFEVSTQRDAVAATLGEERVLAMMTTAFAVLALLLAGIGVYGVMSYATGQRTSEIGLRIALGARGRSILLLVARRTVTLVGLGVALGLVVSLMSSPHFARLLYGLTPADPLSILLAVVVISAAALIATFVPANRARRVSPMVALRHE